MSNAPRQSVIHTAIKRKHPPPCKNCTDRVVGCHGKCDKYVEYKKAIETESNVAFVFYSNERKLNKAEIQNIQKQRKQ